LIARTGNARITPWEKTWGWWENPAGEGGEQQKKHNSQKHKRN